MSTLKISKYLCEKQTSENRFTIVKLPSKEFVGNYVFDKPWTSVEEINKFLMFHPDCDKEINWNTIETLKKEFCVNYHQNDEIGLDDLSLEDEYDELVEQKDFIFEWTFNGTIVLNVQNQDDEWAKAFLRDKKYISEKFSDMVNEKFYEWKENNLFVWIVSQSTSEQDFIFEIQNFEKTSDDLKFYGNFNKYLVPMKIYYKTNIDEKDIYSILTNIFFSWREVGFNI